MIAPSRIYPRVDPAVFWAQAGEGGFWPLAKRVRAVAEHVPSQRAAMTRA